MITYTVEQIGNRDCFIVVKNNDGVLSFESSSFPTRELAEAKRKEIIWTPDNKLKSYMRT